RGRAGALALLPRLRGVSRRQRRHHAGLDGQAEGWPHAAPGDRRLPAILGRRGLPLGIADRPCVPRFAPRLDRWRRRRGHAADHLQADGHPAPAGEPLMGDAMAEFASRYETLLLRRERSRLYVTLNRPQVKNALNPVLIGELRTVFQNLADRRDVKTV